MSKRRHFAAFGILLVFVVSLPMAHAEPASVPIDHGLRIFVTGHSFHIGMVDPLKEIAASAGLWQQKILGMLALGGSRTINIWDIPEHQNTAKNALYQGKVDVLTMAPHIELPDQGVYNFVVLGLLHNPDMRFTFQLSWLPLDIDPFAQTPPPEPKPGRNEITKIQLLSLHQRYYAEAAAQIRSLNQMALEKVGHPALFAVPIGPAFISLREAVRSNEIPGINSQDALFADTYGHPDAIVRLLNAYCHYAVIYRRSPEGLPTPHSFARQLQDEKLVVDIEALNSRLQKLAWDTVSHYPDTGVTMSPVGRAEMTPN